MLIKKAVLLLVRDPSSITSSSYKPYSKKGSHQASNRLLLESDSYTLYDDGYITIDTELRVNISKRLHKGYDNGKDYYKHDGQKLLMFLNNSLEMPSIEFVEWHNEIIYLG